jgi:hypothetical protein
MLSTASASPREEQLDSLVDSWFTQTPSVSSEEVDALEVEPAECADSTSSEASEEQPR